MFPVEFSTQDKKMHQLRFSPLPFSGKGAIMVVALIMGIIFWSCLVNAKVGGLFKSEQNIEGPVLQLVLPSTTFLPIHLHHKNG